MDGNPYHLYPFQTGFGAPVFGTDASGGYDATKLELGNAGGDAFATWLGSQGKNGTGVFNTEITGEARASTRCSSVFSAVRLANGMAAAARWAIQGECS